MPQMCRAHVDSAASLAPSPLAPRHAGSLSISSRHVSTAARELGRARLKLGARTFAGFGPAAAGGIPPTRLSAFRHSAVACATKFDTITVQSILPYGRRGPFPVNSWMEYGLSGLCRPLSACVALRFHVTRRPFGFADEALHFPGHHSTSHVVLRAVARVARRGGLARTVY